MRATFVTSEVGAGLRRNLTMTFAVIITVAVSLALFGVSLLVRAQVSTMQDFWYDKPPPHFTGFQKTKFFADVP